MKRTAVRKLTWLFGALLASVLTVAVAPTPASAVPHPPPPPGTVGTQGVYPLRTSYANSDLSSVRAWSVTWTVPQSTNNAWGVVGQWFSNIEGGIYYTDTEGWWVYYYGDDNGLTGNNPDCFESWGTGGHCLSWGANLPIGKQVTFVYEYCNASKAFNANGPYICLYVNMNDGVGNRYLMQDLPRAEGPEMYTHDIEHFADSGATEPVISCTNPTKMLGQKVRINSAAWTNLTGSAFDFVDEQANYEFRNVNYTASPATWQSCTPPSNACPGPVWSPKRNYVANDQLYWNQRKYRAIVASTAVRPGTSATTWQDLGTC
ncbi:hypothetical protein Acsp02_48070 [Actinoplanes sp. NBRC 103695]|nr:hypothetical protein Acsp02_48070 [Actinoplanes sp. NBRC 103695]